MAPKIRWFKSTDYGPLADLVKATRVPPWEGFGESMGVTPDALAEEFALFGEDPGDRVLVAEDTVGLAGFLLLDPKSTEQTVRMTGPVVHPEYRKQGVGMALFREAVKECGQRYRPRILRNVVGEKNPGAQALLVRNGFIPARRSVIYHLVVGGEIPVLRRPDAGVQTLSPDLFDEAVRLIRSEFPGTWKDRAQFQREFRHPDCLNLVLIRNNDMVGFMSSIKDEEGEAWLEYMVIRDAERRGGFGKMLLSEVLNQSRQRWGVRRAGLSVRADNVPAIQMYERFGFVAQGGVVVYEKRMEA